MGKVRSPGRKPRWRFFALALQNLAPWATLAGRLAKQPHIPQSGVCRSADWLLSARTPPLFPSRSSPSDRGRAGKPRQRSTERRHPAPRRVSLRRPARNVANRRGANPAAARLAPDLLIGERVSGRARPGVACEAASGGKCCEPVLAGQQRRLRAQPRRRPRSPPREPTARGSKTRGCA